MDINRITKISCKQPQGVEKRTEIDEYNLSNKIGQIIEKLRSIDVKSWNIRGNDFEKLMENMFVIEGSVLCAEKLKRKHGTNTHVVKLWLKQLKDFLYDVDEFSTQGLRHQNKNKNVENFISSSNHLIFSSKMATKIKDLTKRIEGLHIILNISHPCEQVQPRVNKRETMPYTAQQFFGREKEKKNLIDFLLNTNKNVKGNVSIIFIIGDEGIGKSALAQAAYNDKGVQRYFELSEWFWISNEFNIRGIGQNITHSYNKKSTLDYVQKKIRDKFDGKRYLLVLDDMLIDHRNIWHGLMDVLKCGAKGSKIIVTTRSKEVASINDNINLSSSIVLDKLNEEHSWKMFCLYAFQDEKEPVNQELVSTGKAIVKKCFGIPLAIYKIGLVMHSEETKNWSYFKNKNLVEIDEQGLLAIFQNTY